MNFDEFQKQALKTVAIGNKESGALSHRTFGLVGETGIIANQVKKIIPDKDGKASIDDIEIIKKRLGDTLYYVAVLTEFFNLKLSDVAKGNIEQSADFMFSKRSKK